jgi:hypothetical protein
MAGLAGRRLAPARAHRPRAPAARRARAHLQVRPERRARGAHRDAARAAPAGARGGAPPDASAGRAPTRRAGRRAGAPGRPPSRGRAPGGARLAPRARPRRERPTVSCSSTSRRRHVARRGERRPPRARREAHRPRRHARPVRHRPARAARRPGDAALPHVSGDPKVYEATVRFGAETDTEDLLGASCARRRRRASRRARRAPALTGTLEQVPPAYSAKRVRGAARTTSRARARRSSSRRRRVRVDAGSCSPGATAPSSATCA